MSIDVMSAVWKSGPETHGELIVLLAFSDFADDEGRCWPSMVTIARKARMSERNARRIVRKLEDAGYLTTSGSGGRTSNLYVVVASPNPDNMSTLDQPGQIGQPGQYVRPTRTNGAPNPDIAVSAEPLRTINEEEDIPDGISLGGIHDISQSDINPPKRKRSVRSLPDDWTPDIIQARRIMDDLSLTESEMNYCYQQMKGHALGKDRKLVSWDQGFGNWCRKAARDGEIGPESRSRKSANGARDTAFD